MFETYAQSPKSKVQSPKSKVQMEETFYTRHCSIFDERHFLTLDFGHWTVFYFFINSNTAEVIAFTPVRNVGSGKGWNRAECNDGKGVPASLLCLTFTGSTAPSVKSVAGIF